MTKDFLTMNDFKLIAIRPLCPEGSEFMKILKKDFYVFYNDYSFIEVDFEVEISFSPQVPSDLYQIASGDRKIPINISALAGKNGSGKSTLFEILFYANYMIANEFKTISDLNRSDLERDFAAEIYYKVDNNIFCLTINNDLEKHIKLVVFKTIDGSKYIIQKKRGNLNLVEKELILENFFYTVAINYSIYGLNSKQLGLWIEKLFHKNDGYQTPIVINPFRDEGNIDINNENDLLKQRLLSNILDSENKGKKNLRELTKNKIATKLYVKLNYSKLQSKNDVSSKDLQCIKLLANKYIISSNLNSDINDYTVSTPEIKYLISKLKKLCSIYTPYRSFLKNNEFSEIESFTSQICLDSSHITFKVKQTLNYVLYKKFFPLNNIVDGVNGIIGMEVDIEEIANNIYTIQQKESSIRVIPTIELIPPSFFDIIILFQDNSSFEKLSSGEKQKIHTINSIIYHLININSVFENKIEKHGLYTYKHINLFLDEIELYFHPEYQRCFINDLLKYLENVDHSLLKNIKGINICFSTHSPFILSDIPKQNVLLLSENGTSERSIEHLKTFGSNIHELLAHSFFLGNGLIGEFAKSKIQIVIDQLTSQKGNLNGESILKTIQIIGEPFLREKLLEMYYVKFSKQKRIDDLREELKRLEEND